MQCEICGVIRDSMKEVLIEGVKMKVCEKCENLGTPVNRNQSRYQSFSSNKKNSGNSNDNNNSNNERNSSNYIEEEDLLKSNYGALIKSKREELGIKQEDLAKMISEKESLIHKMESSNIIINMAIARKIERILKIKIIEKGDSSSLEKVKYVDNSMTLGDLIKQKIK